MNLSTLIKQYFPTSENDVTIDVFDERFNGTSTSSLSYGIKKSRPLRDVKTEKARSDA